MNRETIERLAIDSAAGEMNEDVRMLFETYLAEHPEAQKWSKDMLDVYEKTQTIIDTKITEGQIGYGKQFVRKNHLLRLNWQSFARWAAVIVFACLTGFTAGRWEKPGQTNIVSSHQPTLNAGQVRTVSDLRDKYAGTFWGDKMLAMLESKPIQRGKSNFQNGGFWDKYKQYKGEQL